MRTGPRGSLPCDAWPRRRRCGCVGGDARRGAVAHPGIEFEEGQLDDLPIDEGSLAGVVCWYSIIYTPPECLGDAFAELGRVLSPGGYLLVAFQAGSGEPVHRTDAHGTGFSLTSLSAQPRRRDRSPGAGRARGARHGAPGTRVRPRDDTAGVRHRASDVIPAPTGSIPGSGAVELREHPSVGAVTHRHSPVTRDSLTGCRISSWRLSGT